MATALPIDGRSKADFDVVRTLEILADKHPDRCSVSPSPELGEKIKKEVKRLQGQKRVRELTDRLAMPRPQSPGLNDALIIPGSYFPLGTSVDRVRSAGADRAPLHGTLRVIVVLVEFSDQAMTATRQEFEDLFFSNGVIPTGSVREYFDEVTNGLVDLQGDVVGPFTMPRTLTAYANGASGTGAALPNARTMARDAAAAADATVNFAPYDNDSNGFVDAFIVVHAGAGAESTGDPNDIWAHKWVLSGGEFSTDSTKIFAYLTVGEDARIGLCAHELGHLLFGLPDLYDANGGSEGIGNWCLMGGGNWLGGGDTPGHPSAWCKSQQGWVSVQNVTTNGPLNIPDVKDSQTVYRLWKDGTAGSEYFLMENRQKDRYDEHLPGEGLFIWHIDEAIPDNHNQAHYKVALEQADGQMDLENNVNRGDAGDPFPGSSNNSTFNNSSTPDSKSYGGVNTCVSVTGISPSASVMTAQVQVRCPKPKELQKDFKDFKDGRKDFKEPKETKEFRKEFKDLKDGRKDFKEPKEFKEDRKESKEPKELKESRKEFEKQFEKREEKRFEKQPEKPEIDKSDQQEKPPITEGRPGFDFDDFGMAEQTGSELSELESRIAALEARLYGDGPFIGQELRPDLTMSQYSAEPDQLGPQMIGDKRTFDNKPPESASNTNPQL